jgi:hypothetical protein
MRVPLPLATLSMLGVNTVITLVLTAPRRNGGGVGIHARATVAAQCANEPVCACGLVTLAEKTRCFWGCLESMWSVRWGRGGGWYCIL